jgi:hypothetical protein
MRAAGMCASCVMCEYGDAVPSRRRQALPSTRLITNAAVVVASLISDVLLLAVTAATAATGDTSWKTLQSEGWYLDFTGDGWDKFYDRSLPSDGSTLGGEACSWSEHANDANFFHRVFQRLPAAAERLWSAASVTDKVAAEVRSVWCLAVF